MGRNRKRNLGHTSLSGPLITLLANGLGVLLIPLALNLAYQLRQSRNHPLRSRDSCLLSAIYLVRFCCSLSWMFELITLSRMRYFLVLWFPCMILISYSVTTFSRSIEDCHNALNCMGMWQGSSFGRSGQIREYAIHDKRTWQFPRLHDYTSSLKRKSALGRFCCRIYRVAGCERSKGQKQFYDS